MFNLVFFLFNETVMRFNFSIHNNEIVVIVTIIIIFNIFLIYNCNCVFLSFIFRCIIIFLLTISSMEILFVHFLASYFIMNALEYLILFESDNVIFSPGALDRQNPFVYSNLIFTRHPITESAGGWKPNSLYLSFYIFFPVSDFEYKLADIQVPKRNSLLDAVNLTLPLFGYTVLLEFRASPKILDPSFVLLIRNENSTRLMTEGIPGKFPCLYRSQDKEIRAAVDLCGGVVRFFFLMFSFCFCLRKKFHSIETVIIKSRYPLFGRCLADCILFPVISWDLKTSWICYNKRTTRSKT